MAEKPDLPAELDAGLHVAVDDGGDHGFQLLFGLPGFSGVDPLELGFGPHAVRVRHVHGAVHLEFDDVLGPIDRGDLCRQF
jgi:hypothetical protein